MNWFNEFNLPEAKSTYASDVDALFFFLNATSFIILIGTTITVIYFIIRYKRKSDDDVTPLITHNTQLEIAWAVIPLILVLIVFGWGFKGHLTMRNVPETAYEVKVTGFKWAWRFSYANGAVSPNELHVPAGRPIKLVMSSTDVIHSFFVPDYRMKQDVVPGRYTTAWFEAPEPGESIVFCTEYCGTSHSNMMAKVIVHEQADFDLWLASNKAPTNIQNPIEYGEKMVTDNACLTCHSLDGSALVGPSFVGLFGRDGEMADGTIVTADENYIRESILNPQAKIVKGYAPVMPTYQGAFADEQIDAIIEYLKTVK
jgi:cytochrome c oxidase subunit 2